MRNRAGTLVDEIADVTAPVGTPCACGLRLLSTLPAASAAIVHAVDVEGRDPRTVAEELGILTNNLYVRLHRARRSLRALVEEHCGVRSMGPCLDCVCGVDARCSDAAAEVVMGGVSTDVP